MAQARLPVIHVEISGDTVLLTKDAVVTVGLSSGVTLEQRQQIKSEISAQFPPDTKIYIYNRDMMDVRIIIPIDTESDPA